MRISVIIPVYNEQAAINGTIARLNDCEIVVSDCTGSTLDVISDSSVIKKVRAERGRGNQLNAGAKAATGEILLFLHADTELPESWVRDITENIKFCDAGAFSLGIDDGRFIFRIIERTATLRTKLTKIPYGDQAIFVKREIFDKTGGFADFPIFEDFRLMQDIKKTGANIHILPQKVKTSARRWQKEGILYVTLRNWFITILYLCGVSPHKLKKLYR